MTTAIILAAGRSTRMGAQVDKAFLSLVDKPVLAWSLLAFERCAAIDRIVIVVRKDKLLATKEVARRYGISKLQTIVAGGARRQDSVLAGLEACDLDTRFVVIHDAARPCVTSETINELMVEVKRSPAVTIGRPVTDTVKRLVKCATVGETVPRDKMWVVQTPQAFQIKPLRDAYKALPPKTDVTDDCQVLEQAGVATRVVENLQPNFKITTVEDLQVISAVLRCS